MTLGRSASTTPTRRSSPCSPRRPIRRAPPIATSCVPAALDGGRGHVPPPWFHRNLMSEFMGLVHGAYDAKADGFLRAARRCTIRSRRMADMATFERGSTAELKPHKIADTLAFMFETRLVIRPTEFALGNEALQRDYDACWRVRGRFADRDVTPAKAGAHFSVVREPDQWVPAFAEMVDLSEIERLRACSPSRGATSRTTRRGLHRCAPTGSALRSQD